MEVKKALEQIQAIHEQMIKGEVYSGHRSVPVGLIGLAAFLFAGFQALFQQGAQPLYLFAEWVGLAILVLLGYGAWLIAQAVRDTRKYEQRLALRIFIQFLPTIAGGAAVAYFTLVQHLIPLSIFPGLLSILFCAGLAAMSAWLPRSIMLVAAFYLAASIVLFAMAPSGASLSPLAMGTVFGTGNVLAAMVLHYSYERNRRA